MAAGVAAGGGVSSSSLSSAGGAGCVSSGEGSSLLGNAMPGFRGGTGWKMSVSAMAGSDQAATALRLVKSCIQPDAPVPAARGWSGLAVAPPDAAATSGVGGVEA